MTRDQTKDKLVNVLRESGLSYDDQVKVISMVRVAIQPHQSQSDWRSQARPILKPKEKKAKERK